MALLPTNILYTGAPECQRGPGWEEMPLQVQPKVDIWSFGCILSEAAVWLTKDHEGLQEYRDELSTNPQRGTRFHDGDKVAKTVLEWHEEVRHCIRVEDRVTIPVLKSIEENMLLSRPEGRRDAEGIWSLAYDSIFKPSETLMEGRSSEAPFQSNGHIIVPLALSSRRAPPALLNHLMENQEMTCRYPATYKYLKEQDATIEKCNANIEPVANVSASWRYG
jgi:hypothetical protein